MADLGSILNSVYFSRNFKTCEFFCFMSILLISITITSIHTGFKGNWRNKFKMADPRRRIVPDHFLMINDVIVASLLLLKIINVLSNLLFKYFLLWRENWWNLDSAKKRDYDVKFRHCGNQRMPWCWKWRVHYSV